MKTIAAKTSSVPVARSSNVWVEIAKHCYQNGNVQVRKLETRQWSGDFEHQRWGIFIRRGRKWVPVHSQQRMWAYGSRGCAMRAVSVSQFVEGEVL